MNEKMTEKDGKIRVAVIGGGASGLMCACKAAEFGADVTLFEKNKSDKKLSSEARFDNAYLGKKLLITGKGRCNVTNNSDINTFMKNVPTNPKFLYAAYCAFPPEKTMEFFEKGGTKLKTERGNRVFPQSDKSVDILNVFKKKIIETGVKVVNQKVVSAEKKDGLFEILTDEKQKFSFDKCVICTGGASYKATGSDGDGYRFAKKFGHTVKPLSPSLVPMECKEKELCESLSGLTLKNVDFSVYDAAKPKGKPLFSERGEMLFTHFGISGPLVLSASAHIKNPENNAYRAEIDLKPALSEEKIDEKLVKLFSEKSNTNISNALMSMLPKSLAKPFCVYCGVSPDKKANSVSREERKNISRAFKSFSLEISAFRPIDEAIVTSGGVDVKEINPSTMESKLVKNLYFAGEVMDVDAYTGGFNLQTAFCTAYLAAKNVSKKERMIKMISIAIDGPSGSGKSSLAKLLAKKLGYIHVDTGAIYRTIGLYAKKNGIDPHDEKTLSEHFDKIHVKVDWIDGNQHIFLDDDDVSTDIRTPEISMYASDVSALPKVREFLLEMQRDFARKANVIMDGRDIGTVVLPNADVKIFLRADDEKRAMRRYLELKEKGQDVEYEKVYEELVLRDKNDSTRKTAPCVPAPDSVILDNSDINLEETLEKAIEIINAKLGAER